MSLYSDSIKAVSTYFSRLGISQGINNLILSFMGKYNLEFNMPYNGMQLAAV